ncbi:angiopoietin-1-like [Anopheles darlingi]|uniref:angiopoietin-1-like n=1 Tax=Anopheles darlingi TaxID=43151 RepID=UPI0020FFFD8E|nr:angiopoietin-1-like [Anopheles darlingi]
MKLTIGFLLFCVFYAEATTKKNCGTTDGDLEAAPPYGILAQGLEMVLVKLEQMDRKMLELHYSLNEHREEVERIRASHEKTFGDLLWVIHRLDDSVTKDVGRNMSLLQDQSLLILAQQNACTSHEQFREKWFNFTTENNGGQGSVQPQEGTRISLSALYKSLMPDCVTSTVAPPDRESTTSATTSTAPPTTTTTTKPKLPLFTCRNVMSNVSGVYLISVNNDSTPFKVYCEMEKFEGGWIVVQHRFDGSVDFYRNWNEYREGFGQLDSEFWLGLERMHQLTTARKHELVVEMKDFEGNYGYTRYSSFQVASESKQYELTVGSHSGTAGDGWASYHNGTKFSTKDRDNDENYGTHHAVSYEGGWWYGSGGGYSNLNGPYRNDNDGKAIWWNYFKNDIRGLSFTRMMIREMQ